MRLYRRKPNGPWWVDDTVGRTRIRRSLGVRDRRAARDLAVSLIREYEERHAGTHDPAKEHLQQPVETHVEAFLTSLDAAGVTAEHRADRERRLRRFIAHGAIKTLAEVDLDAATGWIAAHAAEGLSPRTINAGVAALRQWGR